MTAAVRRRRAVLAIAAALLVAPVLGACSGDPGDEESPQTFTQGGGTEDPSTTGDPSSTDDPSSTEPAAPPSTPAPDTTTATDDAGVPVAGVGDCMRASDLFAVITEGDGLSGLPTIDCATEHEVQIVAIYEMTDDAYPGDTEIQTAALAECTTLFEGFVGIPAADSSLSVAPITPSADTWATGARTAYCVAVAPEPTTTSFEGAGI
ncbi:septum formation family protein [Occultella kanbiaonis]|uniref:septum formation family protein n=1 Tax=Occultella kanbiaonis TaxID=2675754 RepID=UPI0012B74644|nr:septum formation family protein [Occultella kanbiaonis]